METVDDSKHGNNVPLFLPYLWGMETIFLLNPHGPVLKSSYRTYEEWKLTFFAIASQSVCQFLPYLWGMETLFWGEKGEIIA